MSKLLPFPAAKARSPSKFGYERVRKRDRKDKGQLDLFAGGGGKLIEFPAAAGPGPFEEALALEDGGDEAAARRLYEKAVADGDSVPRRLLQPRGESSRRRAASSRLSTASETPSSRTSSTGIPLQPRQPLLRHRGVPVPPACTTSWPRRSSRDSATSTSTSAWCWRSTRSSSSHRRPFTLPEARSGERGGDGRGSPEHLRRSLEQQG